MPHYVIAQEMMTSSYVNAPNKDAVMKLCQDEGSEHLKEWVECDASAGWTIEIINPEPTGKNYRYRVERWLVLRKLVETDKTDKYSILQEAKNTAKSPLYWWDNYIGDWWIEDPNTKTNLELFPPKEFDVSVIYSGSTFHHVKARSLEEAKNIATELSLNTSSKDIELEITDIFTDDEQWLKDGYEPS